MCDAKVVTVCVVLKRILGIVAFTGEDHSIVPAIKISLGFIFPNVPADFCVEEHQCLTLCEVSECILVPKSYCFLIVVVVNHLNFPAPKLCFLWLIKLKNFDPQIGFVFADPSLELLL